MRDFKSFLEHEKSVLLNTIEQQTKALNWYKDGDSMAEGHRKMIDVLKRHLAMLDILLEGDIDPDLALATCEEALKMAEEKHRQQIPEGTENNEMWWETLDVIQFVSDLIYRIEDWKKRNRAQALPGKSRDLLKN